MAKQLHPILIILILMYTLTIPVTAQDAIFSQHFAAPMYLNPAFAGIGADSRLVFNYRNQPYPDFGTFSNINFSYDAFVPALNGGLGVVLTSDHQGGLLMKNNLSAVYAYHLRAGENLYVNFGAQAGYTRKDIQWGKLDFPEFEPAPANTWNHAADFAAGILLSANWVYGGIAAHHLTRPNESLLGNYPLSPKYTAHLGFYFEPSKRRPANTLAFDYFVSPNLIFQNQGDYYRINYGFYAGIESLVAGVWYRQDLTNPSAMVILLGLNTGQYRIGYSYDYSLSGYSGPSQGAHEISIIISFIDPIRNLKRQIINCPSF